MGRVRCKENGRFSDSVFVAQMQGEKWVEFDRSSTTYADTLLLNAEATCYCSHENQWEV
jgi:hypothetical protein